MVAPSAVLFLGASALLKQPAFLAAMDARGLVGLGLDLPSKRACFAGELRERLGDVQLCELGEPEQVSACVERWSSRYALEAVLPLREGAVLSAAALSDARGLPGPGLLAARCSIDKAQLRARTGPWSPRWCRARRGQAPSFPPPWILKPCGRAGSSGVVRVDSAQQLERTLAERGDEPHIVEALLGGPEFSIEGLVRAGEVLGAGVTAKHTTEHEGRGRFVELGHLVPAQIDADLRAQLLTLHARVVEAIELDTAITHMELRVDPRLGPRLIEIAVRVPGDAILELHRLARGAGLEPLLVDLLRGRTPAWPPAQRVATERFLAQAQGRFEGVEGRELDIPIIARASDRVRALPTTSSRGEPARVREIRYYKALGETLGAIESSGDRAASVLMDAGSLGELGELEARTLAQLRVRSCV